MQILLAIIITATLSFGCATLEDEQTTVVSGGGGTKSAPSTSAPAVTSWSVTKQFGTSSPDHAYGISTDIGGNVYVTGHTNGGLDGNTNAGSSDLFVVKYDSGGIKQWTQQLGTSYDDYVQAFPAGRLPWVSMGAWTAVEYKQDEVVILRRNPYYWKVDSKGQQLPYMNEMVFQLKTWGQRTVDTLAGNADFSNMENVPLYLEAVKESKSDDAQAQLSFSGRTMGYALAMNQAVGFGVLDDQMAAIRDLNRNLEFRKAITHAIDGKAFAKAMSKGPFVTVYAGGLARDSAFFDADATSFFPYNPAGANSILDGLGLMDTDGNGVRNLPNGGGDLVINLVQNKGSENEMLLGDGMATMMAEVGIKINIKPMEDTEPTRQAGEWDWLLVRSQQEMAFPNSGYWSDMGPVTTSSFDPHLGTDEHPQQLQSFEKEIVSILEQWRDGVEGAEAQALMSRYQKLFTENVYMPGIVQYPTALLINKRIQNLADGMPVLAYQWAEDTVIREQFWVYQYDQLDELFPGRVPGID